VGKQVIASKAWCSENGCAAELDKVAAQCQGFNAFAVEAGAALAKGHALTLSEMTAGLAAVAGGAQDGEPWHHGLKEPTNLKELLEHADATLMKLSIKTHLATSQKLAKATGCGV
jgi:hypothetical protein